VVKDMDRHVDKSVVMSAGSGASIVQNSNLNSDTYASTEIADSSTSTVTERASEAVPDTSTLTPAGNTHDTSVPPAPAAPSAPLPQPENRAVAHGGDHVAWRYADGGGGGGGVIHGRHAPFMVVAAYLTALALALIAAW
jgi:hypothetical protein